jgi:hypothetical protein
MAVIDVVEKRCKISGDAEVVSSTRFFNEKFVDTPEKALLFAFDEFHDAWRKDPAEIMKNVVYDAEEKEYVRRTILTRDGHTPTEKQMAKILNGTYEYILIEEFVQVFSTDLIYGENLINSSVEKWRKRTGKF